MSSTSPRRFEVTYAFEIVGGDLSTHHPLPKRTFTVAAHTKRQAGVIVADILQFRADRLNRRKKGNATVHMFLNDPRMPFLQYRTTGRGSIRHFKIYAQIL